jgi:flagellar hook-associated protein 2
MAVDSKAIVSQLMAVERIPQDMLKQRVATLQKAQTAWGNIGSALGAFQTASEALAPANALGSMTTASSSNTDAIGVSALAGAQASSASVQVIDLATTHAVVSRDTFTGPTASAAGHDVTVTVNGTAKTVTSTDGTMGGLVDAINASGAGAKAKLLQVSPGTYQLVLTGASSGASAAFTATGNGFTGFDVTTQGADAHLKVDGIDVYRSTNTISDLLPGLELRLKQKTTSAVTVSATRDDDSIVKKVQAMVDAANKVINTVDSLTATSPTAASRGPLSGNSTARGISDQIRAVIAAGLTGADGVTRPSSSLGISLTKDGSITFDESKLRAWLASDAAGVAASLGRGGNSSIANVTVTSVTSSAVAGPHAISVARAATQATMVGAPVPPPPPGTVVNMTINTPSGSYNITFTAGATWAATSAAFNQALASVGAALQTSTEGTALTLTDKRFGTGHQFSVTGADAVGLTGTSSAGADALVNLDGTNYTGTGKAVLAGGLALSVGVTEAQLAGSGGIATGTLQVSGGLAGAFAAIGKATSFDGAVSTAQSSLTSQMKVLNDRISQYATGQAPGHLERAVHRDGHDVADPDRASRSARSGDQHSRDRLRLSRIRKRARCQHQPPPTPRTRRPRRPRRAPSRSSAWRTPASSPPAIA